MKRDLFLLAVQFIIVWCIIELITALNRQLIVNDLVKDFRRQLDTNLHSL